MLRFVVEQMVSPLLDLAAVMQQSDQAKDVEIEALIEQLARENLHWGYSGIHNGLGKLGYSVGRSTVWDVLKRDEVSTAPQQGEFGSTWRNILKHRRHQMLACNFFTVETFFLRTVYALLSYQIISVEINPSYPTYSATYSSRAG